MPSSRMHRGLVALSASAVAAIYMAGYLRTQSADAGIGASAAALSPGVTSRAAIATNPPAGATRADCPPGSARHAQGRYLYGPGLESPRRRVGQRPGPEWPHRRRDDHALDAAISVARHRRP